MIELIAIAGKKRHGKNATADLILANLTRNGKHVAIRHFADAVKEECAEMLTYHTRRDVLDHLLKWSKTEEIALGVYADLFLLKRQPGLMGRIKWALGIGKWRGYTPAECSDSDNDFLETYQYILDCMYGKHGDEMKERFRTWMQWYGTDYKRDCIDKNYWVNQLFIWIRQKEAEGKLDFVLIPDARFLNEVAFAKALGGKVLRVIRPALTFLMEGTEVSKHISETALDEYDDFNWMLDNSSDLKTLGKKIGRMLVKLYPAK